MNYTRTKISRSVGNAYGSVTGDFKGAVLLDYSYSDL